MLATSGAQLIGRDQLQSPESSPRSSPDPAITELLRSRIRNEYAFTAAETGADEQGDVNVSGDKEEEAELILFSAPINATQSHKIRLSSPDAAITEPGFLVKKPRSYYFANDVTRERQEELEAAAVTGDYVMELSRVPWPGCALPWKVRTIKAAGMEKSVLVGHPPNLVKVEEKIPKKKRKGKKSRIALRAKLQAAKEREAQQAQLTLEKEETEREKRTRRNREKKVKKKARDKAKKLAEAETENLTLDSD